MISVFTCKVPGRAVLELADQYFLQAVYQLTINSLYSSCLINVTSKINIVYITNVGHEKRGKERNGTVYCIEARQVQS